MQELAAIIQTEVKGVERSLLGSFIVAFHDWLDSLDIVVCELLQPEIVDVVDHGTKIVFFKANIC